jgi:hypothetical protein
VRNARNENNQCKPCEGRCVQTLVRAALPVAQQPRLFAAALLRLLPLRAKRLRCDFVPYVYVNLKITAAQRCAPLVKSAAAGPKPELQNPNWRCVGWWRGQTAADAAAGY